MGAQQVKLLRSLDNAEDRTILAGEFARHAPEGTLQLRAFLSFTTALVDHLVAKHAEDGVEGDVTALSLLHYSSAVLAPPFFFSFYYYY
jgi:hypothetical protein